jgi:triacylglycerol lipase
MKDVPVVFVHGIWKDSSAFRVMSKYLERRGFETYAIDLEPNNGSVTIEVLAEQLAKFVKEFGAPVDLVGFSMGGLVSRYYIQRLGGSEHVRKFITIGSPNHGTLTASLGSRPAIQQMRVGSPLIVDLNSDVGMLLKHDVISIWTPFDLMVTPGITAKLPVGSSFLAPTLIHHLMLSDNRVLNIVEEELS